MEQKRRRVKNNLIKKDGLNFELVSLPNSGEPNREFSTANFGGSDYVDSRGKKQKMYIVKNNLTKTRGFAYPTGLNTKSGSSAPVSSGFFVPVVYNTLPTRRADRAEYNSFRANKPIRLLADSETRRLSNAA